MLIYRFAREADDFADEGNLSPAERLALLQGFGHELDRIASGEPPSAQWFGDLGNIIREFGLPLAPFHDLLSAFAQDVTQDRYANYAQVLDYCRRSANPIGRLLLLLYGRATPQNNAWADAICSALQLINFWQDVAIDHRKNRIYFPQDEMSQFGISEEQIADQNTSGAWQSFMRFQVDRARALLLSGAPLGRELPGRLGMEMRMIIAGGNRILTGIAAVNYDVFHRRPVLKPLDWVRMFAHAVTT